MIKFFGSTNSSIIAVDTTKNLTSDAISALEWLFSGAKNIDNQAIDGQFIGPRKEMITPWSTSAVEITINMNISGITRIEEYFPVANNEATYDKMLQRLYKNLDQNIFTTDKKAEEVIGICDIAEYNKKEGLALSKEEVQYLESLAIKLGRKLTDSEVFGFSQVNSEHCRHKIFNGTFVIDGVEMESSLFKLIKKTSAEHPGRIVSAYKDNCAFIQGPEVGLFYPASGTKPDFFQFKKEETVISLKAETHNFPTTVEPFNGAATGSGGEIRDRIAGGKGSFPIAGTAVYMTSYPRLEEEKADVKGDTPRVWEKNEPRKWLYQTPQEILIKASNGASDFGNKFGQPLICGSLYTFEHSENGRDYGFDKVIMLAGGVGYAKKKDSLKDKPGVGDSIVLLGGDNYRIGMGGGAVSSVATGEYNNSIELNAIQRSNPEMQKRAYNAIRALAESDNNTIISVHDHGAGGHLNCLSELVEDQGGNIDISKLPVGDPTLSAKELIGNESQERMGLVMRKEDVEELRLIAERERAPFYEIGETTGKHNFTLRNDKTGETPIDLALSDMFGSAPKTIMTDISPRGGVNGKGGFAPISDTTFRKLNAESIESYTKQLLQIESVACKDWLTNKVDRSVTGLIACQQTCGEVQLPLNNLGLTAIGYDNKEGIATSIGHAPAIALIDAAAGSRMAISESLTNLIWTPIRESLSGVSLSANWMWPCKNEGENTRLYQAVKAASDFAIDLGINIPTGKDSMSMTQKYPDGKQVMSPGTLIVSTVGESLDIYKTIHPVLSKQDSTILYIPFVETTDYPLGGSAFAQVTNVLGQYSPDVNSTDYFALCFNTLQKTIFNGDVLAGHDISSGGLITTLLEMCFANIDGGMELDIREFGCKRMLFSEVPGVILQIANDKIDEFIINLGEVKSYKIGKYISQRKLIVNLAEGEDRMYLDIDELRDLWFKTSYLFDIHQVGADLAKERYNNYSQQPLVLDIPKDKSTKPEYENYKVIAPAADAPIAAIIREKGSNGDRDMAWALYMAGFRVKDVHMTDLISGRETLEEVKMIVFVGGFSNADTLGSAKGWAGAFLYNEKAKTALDNFYARKDTLSLGVCNGCQLMGELGLITPDSRETSPKLQHNNSHKYESAFVSVNIQNSPSVLLSSLENMNLGIWVAHGEGKFHFPKPISEYNVALKYNYNAYPANPNGSPEAIAGVCSPDGRHLAMMPHPERCLRPWNWAHYPNNIDKVTPWIELFINGRKWLEK